MTQQINLINPALRKKRDLLTAVPLTIAAGAMLVLVLAASTVARQQADDVQAEADKRSTELKASQARLLEIGKDVSEVKADPALVEELANSRAMLNLREEVIGALEGGAFNSNRGFAEFMRGFARQTPGGLWLSGFVLHANGDDLEIRGRMLKSTALPEFIHRLNSEKAFQGLSFSSLVIERPETPASASSVTPGQGATPAAAPPFVEFVLRSNPPPQTQKSAAEAAPPLKSLEIKQ